MQQYAELSLADGEHIALDAREITRTLEGREQRMYAYNGSIPGPLLRVRQGSFATVEFKNNLPEPTTIHWHGLRQDYRDDGVPDVSQAPVQPGRQHTYTLRFPDAGVFWYHPHVREDRQQDLGLYGVIIVEPADGAWPAADKEAVLVLDDLLLDDAGRIVPHGRNAANFALMGRYGNAMLTNGKERERITLDAPGNLRLFIVNAANVRPFNFSIKGATLRVIGGDIGLLEEPKVQESVVLGPAERAIVDVSFASPGTYMMRNVNLWAAYDLGEIVVGEGGGAPAFGNGDGAFAATREDIERYRPSFGKEPDIELRLGVAMPQGGMMDMMDMHSVTDIEWEDTMGHHNAMMTSDMARWFLEDKRTGERNMDIHYSFPEGTVAKIRIENDPDGLHPMQHPIHLHGQRFLVVAIDGVPLEDLAWKDTVLIPSGKTADLLVDMSNPGEWMLHCHIAEHLASGMMAMITITEGARQAHAVGGGQ
jgi:FtsP/CotA-like multicopper oxidase with cupredoxin domain